jgi:hypothetical protein
VDARGIAYVVRQLGYNRAIHRPTEATHELRQTDLMCPNLFFRNVRGSSANALAAKTDHTDTEHYDGRRFRDFTERKVIHPTGPHIFKDTPRHRPGLHNPMREKLGGFD